MESVENTNAAGVYRDYGPNELVPKEARHMSYFDNVITWAGGMIQPTNWTIGAVLVCAGFLSGSIATILAIAAACAVMGVIGYIGYKTGASTVGSFKTVLGLRGSRLVSIAAAFCSCGWQGVGSYVASISISYILNALFGMPAFGQPGCATTMLLGAFIVLFLGCMGVFINGSRSLKAFEKIMMVALVVLGGVITVALFRNISLKELIAFRVPVEFAISGAEAFSMMFVVVVTLATLMCDFTRYSKSIPSATTAHFVGGTAGLYWFCAMGMAGCIIHYKNTGIFDLDAANPSTLCMELGLGIPMLLVIIFAVVTTNMMDIFSSSLQLQNLFPKLKSRSAVILSAAICMALAVFFILSESFYNAFYVFVDATGVIFLPLFAIQITDFFIVQKQQIHEASLDDVTGVHGKYWYTKGFNLVSIGTWVVGVILTIIFRRINLAGNSIGYALCSMAASAVVYYAIAMATKKSYYKE